MLLARKRKKIQDSIKLNNDQGDRYYTGTADELNILRANTNTRFGDSMLFGCSNFFDDEMMMMMMITITKRETTFRPVVKRSGPKDLQSYNPDAKGRYLSRQSKRNQKI